jgi:hypothetical protein
VRYILSSRLFAVFVAAALLALPAGVRAQQISGGGSLAIGTTPVTNCSTTGFVLTNNNGVLNCVSAGAAPSVTGPASNVALQAISVTGFVAGTSITRLGFYAAGDGGAAVYTFSPSNCTAADNGAQVQPASGTGCWVASFAGVTPPVSVWGAFSYLTSDQAPPINAALAYVSSVGGGAVTVPAGPYTLLSQVTVRPRARLQCANSGVALGYLGTPATTGGTIFSVGWGSGSGSSNDHTDAAVVLQRTATIDGCGFNYPSQVYTATSPIEYGATILAYDTTGPGYNNSQTATNNFCFNCYSFLDFRGSISGEPTSNVRAEYNWGAPIAFGLRVNYVTDWSHFGHNIFHAGGFDLGDSSYASHLGGWISVNGVAFEIGNSDWINLEDEQEWGYASGILIIYNGTYYSSFGPIWVSNSQFDGCTAACIADAPATTDVGIANLRITGNTFAAYNSATYVQSESGSGIALYISGNSPVKGLDFSHNFIFGPTNYVGLFSNVVDLVIADNISSPNAVSSIAAAGPAFTLSSGTTAIVTNNVMAGFNSVYSIGTYTNVINTGNFTH